MTHQVTQDLLPCPFCGGVAELTGHQAPEFWVRCDRIGCKSSTEAFGSKDKAIAAWNTRQSHTTEWQDKLVEALDVLSGLSIYLGAGMGDEATTALQFDERIRWGIDHIGSVYRNRAAQVVEECSKRPSTTWGQVRRAILDDTALPAAQATQRQE